MFPIASATVGAGGASSITFSSIPQNFTHLQLRLFYKDSSASGGGGLYGNFNNDSSTYWSHWLTGNGSSASSSSGSDTRINSGQTILPNASLTNIFGCYIFDFLDYSNTNKYKTVKMLGGYDANGSGLVTLQSWLWQQTAGIQSISLGGTSGLTQYSRADLYGIQTSNATGA